MGIMTITTVTTIDSDSIWLEPCENGFILCWTVCTAMPRNGSCYDMCNTYCTEKEVFTAKEGAKAIARMQEIYKSSGEEMTDKD